MHAAALARVLLLVSAGLLGSSAAYAMLHSEERAPLPSVDEVSSWKQRGVIIVEPAKFQTMKKQFLTAGLSKIQVIADFDRTISKSRMEPGGPHTQTSHGIIETSPFMPQEYKEQAKALKDKYFPFEYDPKIPTDKKYRLMQEWWDNAHLLITKYKLNKQIISKSVNASLVKLRDRFDEMVNLLHIHEVPLLVFSAGLAETIDEFLRKEGLLKHNMFVVGNRMHFDGSGAVVRFDDPVIHSLNKNYGRVRDTPFVKRVRAQNRNLVILLGDNVADNKMVEGMKPEELKSVLRIGFLNDNIDKLIEDYKKVFDIVILNDGNMDFPFELLKEIAQAHPNDPITTCKALGRIPETAASNLPSESGQSHSDSSSSSSSSSNSLNPPQAPRIAQTQSQTQSANASLSSSSSSSSSSSQSSALVEVVTAAVSTGRGGGSSAVARLFSMLPYEEISEH